MAMQPGEQVNPQFRRTIEAEQERDRRRVRGRPLGRVGRAVFAGIALASVVGAVVLWSAGWGIAGVIQSVLIVPTSLVVAIRG